MAVIRWTPLYEPGCGGWLTSVAVSPHNPRHVLLGGDMLGIGLSTDGGDSWQTILRRQVAIVRIPQQSGLSAIGGSGWTR
jgi:hypothetical protein